MIAVQHSPYCIRLRIRVAQEPVGGLRCLRHSLPAAGPNFPMCAHSSCVAEVTTTADVMRNSKSRNPLRTDSQPAYTTDSQPTPEPTRSGAGLHVYTCDIISNNSAAHLTITPPALPGSPHTLGCRPCLVRRTLPLPFDGHTALASKLKQRCKARRFFKKIDFVLASQYMILFTLKK